MTNPLNDLFVLFILMIVSSAIGSAIAYVWLLYINNGIPISHYHKDIRLYHLSFVNKKAQELSEAGLNEGEIIKRIRVINFGFRKTVPKNQKEIDAISFVEEVIANDDLLKMYVIPYGFSYNQFKMLCEAKDKNTVYLKAQEAIMCILNDTQIEFVNFITGQIVSLLSKPFLLANIKDARQAKGINESYVFSALKYLDIIKKDLSFGQFMQNMVIVSRYYSQMQVLSVGGTSTYHQDKQIDNTMLDLYTNEIKKGLAQYNSASF